MSTMNEQRMPVNELDVFDDYGRQVMINERNEEAAEERHLAARITGAVRKHRVPAGISAAAKK